MPRSKCLTGPCVACFDEETGVTKAVEDDACTTARHIIVKNLLKNSIFNIGTDIKVITVWAGCVSGQIRATFYTNPLLPSQDSH